MLLHIVLLLTCFASFGEGMFISDDPCDVTVWPKSGDPEVIDKNVPEECVNGSFTWDYPRFSVHLHFPNAYRRPMSVCIRNNVLGNIFTVRDITHVIGSPMVIGDKESCTIAHHTAITLRIDAPEDLYYMASLRYHVREV